MSKIFTRLNKFFQDSWQELKRVNWPTSQETNRYTLGVIIFSLTVALVLGLVDSGLIKLMHLFIR